MRSSQPASAGTEQGVHRIDWAVKSQMKGISSSWTAWFLKTGPTGCPETSEIIANPRCAISQTSEDLMKRWFLRKAIKINIWKLRGKQQSPPGRNRRGLGWRKGCRENESQGEVLRECELHEYCSGGSVSRVTKTRTCDCARAHACYRLTSLFYGSTADKPFHVQLKHNAFSYVQFKAVCFTTLLLRNARP
jgi:hypothetical protein